VCGWCSRANQSESVIGLAFHCNDVTSMECGLFWGRENLFGGRAKGRRAPERAARGTTYRGGQLSWRWHREVAGSNIAGVLILFSFLKIFFLKASRPGKKLDMGRSLIS